MAVRNQALGGQVYLSYAEREEMLELLELNETSLNDEIDYHERQIQWQLADIPRAEEEAKDPNNRLLPLQVVRDRVEKPSRLRGYVQEHRDEIARLSRKKEVQRHLAEKLYR